MSNIKIHTITAGVLVENNGDGGVSVKIFPSIEDAEEEKKANLESLGHEDRDIDDCEYECGAVSTLELQVRIDKDRNPILVGTSHLSVDYVA